MSHVVKAVVGAVSTIFGGGDKPQQVQQAAPAPAPAPVMPLPDDAAVQAAKKKQIAAQVAGSGRASTILSQDNGTQKLGG